MKQYFQQLKGGSPAWLFLATRPGSRSLTLALIACLTELALAQAFSTGINERRKIWMIIDELPALGKLPALSSLMAEGRKYGVCVLAAMQSLNQLYRNTDSMEDLRFLVSLGHLSFFAIPSLPLPKW